jgi:predicted Zn-dependent protease
VYGDNRGQGLVRGRDFYHGQMGFAVRFPAGWAIRNLPDKIIASAPGGAAIIQLSLARPAPGQGPRDALLQGLGVPRLGDERALKINSLAAHTGTANVDTDAGKRPARFVAVALGRNVFVITGISREPGTFGQYDAAFRSTGESFRPLAPEEKQLAAGAQRIETLQATDRTTFADLARQSRLGPLAEDQIRLVNGRYPTGEIRPGETLKTIR